MSDFTPDTSMIREAWATSDWFGASEESFDRWIAGIQEDYYWEGYGAGQDSMWLG